MPCLKLLDFLSDRAVRLRLVVRLASSDSPNGNNAGRAEARPAHQAYLRVPSIPSAAWQPKPFPPRNGKSPTGNRHRHARRLRAGCRAGRPVRAARRGTPLLRARAGRVQTAGGKKYKMSILRSRREPYKPSAVRVESRKVERHKVEDVHPLPSRRDARRRDASSAAPRRRTRTPWGSMDRNRWRVSGDAAGRRKRHHDAERRDEGDLGNVFDFMTFDLTTFDFMTFDSN